MKMIAKRAGAMILAMLLSVAVCLPAFADAAPYATPDWRQENKKVVVAAQDGSGYLYLRFGPDMQYEILCNIYDGTVLEITGSCADASGGFRWGHTEYDGMYGWVSLKHTKDYTGDSSSSDSSSKKVKRDVVVQAVDGSGYLYLRSGPSMDYEIYCNIYDGEYLHITEESPDPGGQFVWGKTKYDGKTGWVSLKQTVTKEAYEKDHPTPTPTKEATPKPTKEATPTPTPEPTETPEPEETEEVVEEEEEEDEDADEEQDAETAQRNDNKDFVKKVLFVTCAAVAVVIAAILALVLTKNKR